MRQDRADVVVIGAGIAGASVAFELASDLEVVLIEQESQPGYHTTGRSAAVFSRTYGPPAIRALSRASAGFLFSPPDDFTDVPLVSHLGAMMIAREDQMPALEALQAEIANRSPFVLLDAEGARARQPLLRSDYIHAALLEEEAHDIDVHALHQGFLRGFARRGGSFEANCEVKSIERNGEVWDCETRAGRISAPVIVNAAGAWADAVGAMAGARPIGLVPKRRTAVIVPAPEGVTPDGWPICIDVNEEFYMKPDAGRLLISPADETPSPPCDAQPEEIDVAIAIDRIQTAFDIEVRRVENKWAGLRSFVADKSPVAGYDSDRPGFFWLAGQGGYGIQSSPGLSRAAAALIRRRPLPADIQDEGLEIAAIAPDRLERVAVS